MWVEASAPSNIALIKYMGKLDTVQNKPCNTSISYTLEHLRTYVRIQLNADLKADQWSLYQREDLRPMVLSAKGTEKFLKHFQLLKSEFGLQGFFDIQSANNFPSDCGLASSASSFAALTQTAHDWAVKNAGLTTKDSRDLALLSKKGSGSSCRSFYTPWAVWTQDNVFAVELPYKNLKHQVILCDEKVKSVSSSEAHRQVLTSDLFLGRPERAEKRFLELTSAMKKEDWKTAVDISWNEFWDMHTLFHTSKPAFMYMNSDSQEALGVLLQTYQKNNDGPLVTMDAGSNIHLLYRPDQQATYNQTIEMFGRRFNMWTDEGYRGKS